MWRAPRRYLRSLLAAFIALYFVYFLVSLLSTPSGPEYVRLEKFMNQGRVSRLHAVKSSFDWSKVRHVHLQSENVTSLPKGQPLKFPRVQHAFAPESSQAARTRKGRRDRVRSVFQKDWKSYREFAWKKDALKPISAEYQDQFSGWAATLVDSLDTLWILGMRDEFEEAVQAVVEIDFGESSSSRVNMFETTIRYLGGLLSAYDLSKRKELLIKAKELGDLLYSGFNTASRLPVDFVDFETAKEGTGLFIERWVVSASPGTLSLEMTRLSQLTGDSKYYDAVSRVMSLFHKHQNSTKLPGLWPLYISMSEEEFHNRNEFTLGGGADSLYEYLPKMSALLGGLEPIYKEMTRQFIDTANKYLFFRPMLPNQNDILISGNVVVRDDGNISLDPESEHLTCFIGGTVALAGKLFNRPEDVVTGAKLARGCAFAYNSFASGVMPERYNMVPCEPKRADHCPWNASKWEEGIQKRPEYREDLPAGFTTAKDPRYLLRPEAIESVFLLYRMTGEPEYQELAWKMFESVEKASRTEHGHAAVRDVTKAVEGDQQQNNLEDYMESFWFAETLKYFYLIFSPPDVINLDEYVLNTEAHPFRRPI